MMHKQKRSSTDNHIKTAPQRQKPAPENAASEIALAEYVADPLSLTRLGSMQGAMTHLAHRHLDPVQRQRFAGEIGEVHGNRHLHTVMQSMRHSRATEPLARVQLAEAAPTQTLDAPPQEELPTEAERAAAQAKADAARAQAAQFQSQGQSEATKHQAEQAAEQTAIAALQQKATAANEAAATASPAAAPAAAPEKSAPAANGAAPAGAVPVAMPAQTQQPNAAPAGEEAQGVEGAAPASPAADPLFQGVKHNVEEVATQERAHAPASSEAAEAQAAAESPASEQAGTAQSNQVGEMAAAETPGFDAVAFKAKLMARIEALTPKSAADADEFKEQNKAGTIKDELQSETAAQQDRSQAPLENATAAPPDVGAVPPRQATPLSPNVSEEASPTLDASGAAPKPKSQGEVEAPLHAQNQQLDQQMAAAEVTEEQLATSNEPEFQAAVAAKGTAQTHAATAPQGYRTEEQAIISQAQSAATNTVQSDLTAMHGDRAALMGQVESQQGQAKSADETARAEVGGHIQTIYSETKSKVESVLSSLDSEVDQLFSQGAEAAQATFEAYVDAEMEAYKEDRYGGLLGWTQWIADKFQPTQPEVLAIFQRGRQTYIQAMDAVIDNVTALIGRKLAEAKAEIANGKQRIQEYVAQLPSELQSVGQDAAQAIQSQFDALEQSVDAKQGELIERLANQYNEQLQAVDARIEQLKAENQTLYDMAAEKIGGAIRTILQLKDLLLGVLTRAADAVGKIIADPIGFLGNLVEGVKQGLTGFIGNIMTYLPEGVITWLTGAITGAGITLPRNWDLAGIFQLVMQILGLTFESIMGRVNQLFGFDVLAYFEPIKQLVAAYQAEGMIGVAKMGLTRLIGEEKMLALVEFIDMVQAVISGSWDALWEMIQGHLTDLKELVIGKIEAFIGEEVIKAGITWIISLLNPAGAFIKACKAIYDIVMFFVERGAQVASLVNAVMDSVSAIASGSVGVAASAVEGALARSIPVAIGFLSSLLGLGNISEKVQEIVQTVRGTVNRALDAIFNSGPVQMVGGFIRRIVDGLRGAASAGMDWAKGQLGMGEPKPEEPATDAEEGSGVKARVRSELAKQLNGSVTNPDEVRTILNSVYTQYSPEGLKSLDVVQVPDQPGKFQVVASASPEEEVAQFEYALGVQVGDVVPIATKGFVRPVTTLTAFMLSGNKQVHLGDHRSTDDSNDPLRKSEHAEEHLIWELENLWPDVDDEEVDDEEVDPDGPSRTKENLIVVDLTRSPCEACALDLTSWLAEKRAEGWNVNLHINVASIYGGVKTEQDESGEMVAAPKRAASEVSLRLLREHGVTLSTWDIISILQDENLLDKESIGSIDQEKLQQRIRDTQAVLIDVERIKVGQ